MYIYMGEYLKNPICKFKLLNNSKIYKNKINIVSSCLFKMNNHYKNFNIYINGLKNIINLLNNIKTDFIFRLFIDISIYNDSKIMDIINNEKKIQPILFECYEYKKKNFHIDLFPTLIRYFPFFNFENNDSDIVIVIDIDPNEDDLHKIEYLITNKIKYFTCSVNIEHLFYRNMKPHIYGGLISYNKKFDKNNILNFIKNAAKIKDTGYYKKRLTTFGYGIDEMYINNYLIKNLNTINIIITYNICYFLFWSKKTIFKSKNSNIILKYILGKYYKKDMTVISMFNFIDKNIYLKYKTNKIINYLSKRFYKIIKYLFDKKKKWIEKNIIDFIYKYVYNIIFAFILINMDINNNKIINVKILNSIYVK